MKKAKEEGNKGNMKTEGSIGKREKDMSMKNINLLYMVLINGI